MKENFVTIFTPTYNRGNLLGELYETLTRQTNDNFEWLIYDDGSSDNTEEIVNSFIRENKVGIRYTKAKNGGKHVAINNGSELAIGELFFIVDSDDMLTYDAVDYILTYWKSIPDDKKHLYAGVGSNRAILDKDNNKVVKKLKNEYIDASFTEFSLLLNNKADKAEVFRTELLRKYKFPVFENENFMTEAVIWFKMADDGYIMRWFDEAIYICKYREDGLTQNSFKVRLKNLNGTCHAYNLLSSYKLPKKNIIRYKANYFRFGLHKGNTIGKLKDSLIDRRYWIVSSILGRILYIKDS
ncbi:glycosyltransferase family A protein [Clostridium manihotivorum]|uniref:Glycosyltransferase family 2 protein n=1 Tax=Clostridium manihotivorum TaxID=2320868 RepID=A0A3R5QXL2_9CLOT|nr:glycosyltransferase family 2 protein [Clostridium manihotivorum]QAA35032.1 glycosyltransferase family 2 protein [Clostridium manihotivorum]